MPPFECVGFPFKTDEDFDTVVPDVIERMATEARRLPCPAGFEGWSYRDPSGAGLLAYISKDAATGGRSLHCLKPTFFGGSRQEIAAGSFVEAEECPFCDVARIEVLDATGAVAYPAVVRISDPAFRRYNLGEGNRGRIQITLFALEIDPWKRRFQEGGHSRDLAERAFYPTGNAGDPPRPEAIVSGHVLQAERRRNDLGGAEFVWARIASLAAEYDVVLPTGLMAEPPKEGSVLQVSARVYARWFTK